MRFSADWTHFADEDGTAEELLVAQLADSALRLFRRAVLDDTADVKELSSARELASDRCYAASQIWRKNAPATLRHAVRQEHDLRKDDVAGC